LVPALQQVAISPGRWARFESTIAFTVNSTYVDWLLLKKSGIELVEGHAMNSRDPSDITPPSAKKAWITPEIRDQSIKSLTEVKSNNPSESSPNTGPAS
jgi:hypothetical protein